MGKKEKFLCSVVVPVYNEEQNIKPLTERLTKALQSVPGCKHEIIFAMDPSTDRTEEIILSLRERDPRIKLIRFSRRFGQPASTMGGLRHPRTMKILLRPLYQRGRNETIHGHGTRYSLTDKEAISWKTE